jgi:hypothetical protein
MENEEQKDVNLAPEEGEKKVDESEAAPASEDKKEDGAVDYKAELEKVQARLKKAEFKLTQKDIEERKAKKSEGSEDEDDSGALDIRQQILSAKEEAKLELKREMAADTIQSELSKYADNPARQELIKFHYENTIKQSGFSREAIISDIELAAALADRSTSQKKIDEIQKAVDTAKTVKKTGAVSGVVVDQAGEVKLSEREKRLLDRHGLSAKDINSINI